MTGPGERRRLRILQVSTSDRRGGAEGIARSLRESYREEGHASWLAAGHPSGDDPETIELLAARARLASAADRALGREELRFPATRRLLELAPERPDVLHCHNLHGWYFDLRRLPELSAEVPVVLTLHDAWLLSGHCAHSFDCDRWRTGCGHCPDLSIYPALGRDGTAGNWRRKQAIYRRSRLRVATPSRWLMERVGASMLGPAAVERRVIPNGIDLAAFTPGDRAAARASLGLPQDAPILVFAASGIVDNQWKDWRTLRAALGLVAARRAARHVAAPVLVALGEDRPPERIEGGEVRFLPFQADPARVAATYRAADVYVHATRADTFPTTVLEALACGVPVVASAVGGIPEQVRDGGPEPTGALVPGGDAEALARALEALLDDPARRRRMGEAAAADARARFDARRMARDYLDWFEEAVAC